MVGQWRHALILIIDGVGSPSATADMHIGDTKGLIQQTSTDVSCRVWHNSQHIHQALLCSSHNHPATLINLCCQSIHILYSNQYSICPKNTGLVWNSKCMHSLLLHQSLPLQALDMLAVCSFRRWRPRWALAFKHNQKTDVQTGPDKSGHYILPTQITGKSLKFANHFSVKFDSPLKWVACV